MNIRIQPSKVAGKITAPPSKSYTNRALVLGVFVKDSVRIKNPLLSDDTKAMIACLIQLGIEVSIHPDRIEVKGSIYDIEEKEYRLNADLSGTTIRFLLALSCLVPGTKILSGKEGLNKRPIKDLVDALRQLGAKIEYLDVEGHPPVRVLPSKLSSGKVKINGTVSSQYVSAILMIAPLIRKTTVEVIGDQISKPYIDMTIDTMKQFGVAVSNKDYKKYTIPGDQKYNINEYLVEGDISSASYFFAIAALTKSVLTVKNIKSNSKQADMRFLKILEEMGNKITYKKDQVTIAGKGIKPVSVAMQDCPDQIQTLGVLAAFANGITKITGIQSLRVKETDRVVALERELKKMDVKTSSTSDRLVIFGGNPKPARIDTYGDHRMAMSFAVAAALLSGMEINDPDVVGKTFPDFWKKLSSIGIKTEKIKARNIVLIGMRGSGKTTAAKLLSQKLNKEYLELDEIMVKKIGMSIPEIVEKHGWNFFRDQESEIAAEVSNYHDKIISAGGGIVTRAKNIESLKKNGVLILLKASIETLLQRVGNDQNRPFLTIKKTRKEDMEELLKQRKKLYEQAADETIDTDKLDAEAVVNQILLKLERQHI